MYTITYTHTHKLAYIYFKWLPLTHTDCQEARTHTATATGRRIEQPELKFSTAFAARKTAIYQVSITDFCRSLIILNSEKTGLLCNK